MDFDTTLVFTALVTVMIIVPAINGAVGLLERKLLGWRLDMDAPTAQHVVGS